MTRSSRLAGLAMLAGFSSATAQRSTITRDAFRPRADSLVFTYLAESRAPSASFAVIRGNDTLAYGAHGLADVEAWRARFGEIGEDERVGALAELIARDGRTLGRGRREAGEHREAREAERTHHYDCSRGNARNVCP